MSISKRKQLDAATAERMAGLQDGMSQPVFSQSSADSKPRRAMSFARMVGAGERMAWGNKTYEITPFPVIADDEVNSLFSNSLIACLLALTRSTDKETGEYDYEEAATQLSPLLSFTEQDGAKKAITAELLEAFVTANVVNVSEDNRKAMADLAALTFRRRKEDITPAELLPDLDIPTFCLLLEKICTHNPGYITRF